MTDTTLTCPNCGHAIPLTEALTAQLSGQLETRLRAEHEARIKAATREAEARARGEQQLQLDALTRQLADQTRTAREAETRELALKRRAMELEEQGRTLAERTRLEVEEKLRAENDAKAKTLIDQAEARVRQQSALELDQIRRQLADQLVMTQAAQKRELELARESAELKRKQQELDLELERRLASARAEDEKRLRQLIGDEQSLKLAERDKQIEDMKKVIDDLQRKSQQGSQELQGEVLELDIQAALERQFPHDLIRPVPKGMTGADLIQDVRDTSLNACGQIIWEVKNTKHWQPAWLDKLKADQRESGAALAILVSVALPDGVRGFAQMNGIWITDLAHYPMLALALRDQLQQVAFARAAGQGKNEKMEMLYQYLAGDEFRHRIEAIVEAFTAMRGQLDRERRAMQRHWAEREKQIERVIASTTGMYGALQGIIGQGLPAIAALELDDTALLEGDD
jgi:hypothetical protein